CFRSSTLYSVDSRFLHRYLPALPAMSLTPVAPFRVPRSKLISYLLRSSRESRGNGGDQTVPSIGFLAQPLAPCRRELVKFGAPIVVRCPPLRLQQPLTHQTEQSGIKRALLDQQRLAGDLPDA